jgi:lysophospholipid acyltransferase (LPLAT)-like uncharacterized protein
VVAAEYLRFVGMTTRFTLEPADIYARGETDMPIILAFWHGQHLLAPMARPSNHRVNMLVSRHHDGEVNAIAAKRFGVGAIRGSGNHGGSFVHKAGVAAFQAMVESLADGSSIAMSADVPKVARVVGMGIIKLAQASGRPIYPSAIATNRRYVLNNWDHTTINLPFGRGAGVAAEPCWKTGSTLRPAAPMRWSMAKPDMRHNLEPGAFPPVRALRPMRRCLKIRLENAA